VACTKIIFSYPKEERTGKRKYIVHRERVGKKKKSNSFLKRRIRSKSSAKTAK